MEGLNEQTAERGVLLERARQVSTMIQHLYLITCCVLIFIIYKQYRQYSKLGTTFISIHFAFAFGLGGF
jgi:hypothetical protein